MKRQHLFYLLLLGFLHSGSFAQTCIKTITFTQLVAGPCIVNNESGAEDAAINIYCDNTLSNRLYSAEWSININSTGTYNLPGSPWTACSNGNSFVLGALPAPGNSITLYVQTFEGDDSDCIDPMDGADDCGGGAYVNLNTSVGNHTLSIGNDISFNYTVTESPLITNVSMLSLNCTSPNLYDAVLQVTYDTPVYPCSVSGTLGDLNINGQVFSVTSSPQTITLSNLPADGNNVAINAFFTGSHSSCTYNNAAAFSAPTSTDCQLTGNSGQGCKKEITFTHLLAGAALVGTDNAQDGVEDPAISIYCDNTLTTPVYLAEWAIDITATGIYPLPASPWSACNSTNSFIVGPDTDPGTSLLNVFIQTYEGDDNDCSDPMDAGDNCNASANGTLDLSAGIHQLNIGGAVGFQYRVRNLPIIQNITFSNTNCTSSTAYEATVEVSYDLSTQLICSQPAGTFGNLNINGQSFPVSTSPQTITLGNLPSDNLPVNITAFFEDSYSSCVFNRSNLFTAPDCSIALPTTISSFETTLAGGAVLNNWVSSFERNCAYFTIERSADGISPVTLAHIPATGTTVTTIEYQYTDQDPLPGISYYHLSLTDTDGSTTHLGTNAVYTSRNSAVYPNPATDHIYFTPASSQERFFLTDVTGKVLEVASQKEEEHYLIDLQSLSNGLYYIHTENASVPFVKN